MKRPISSDWLILLVLVVQLLPGCDDSNGEAADTTLAPTTTKANTTSTAATTTAPAATTTSAPITKTVASTAGLSEPVSYGPAVLVSGLEECEIDPPLAAGTTTRDSDGTVHTRDGLIKCTVTNSDPRIAGTAYYTVNLDRWQAAETADMFQLQWGTIRIENEGGAWETEYIGIFSPETGDIGAELYTGTGDYEGLYYYQWVFGTLGFPRPTNGLIFPDTVPIP